jgi:hypothetical protein
MNDKNDKFEVEVSSSDRQIDSATGDSSSSEGVSWTNEMGTNLAAELTKLEIHGKELQKAGEAGDFVKDSFARTSTWMIKALEDMVREGIAIMAQSMFPVLSATIIGGVEKQIESKIDGLCKDIASGLEDKILEESRRANQQAIDDLTDKLEASVKAKLEAVDHEAITKQITGEITEKVTEKAMRTGEEAIDNIKNELWTEFNEKTKSINVESMLQEIKGELTDKADALMQEPAAGFKEIAESRIEQEVKAVISGIEPKIKETAQESGSKAITEMVEKFNLQVTDKIDSFNVNEALAGVTRQIISQAQNAVNESVSEAVEAIKIKIESEVTERYERIGKAALNNLIEQNKKIYEDSVQKQISESVNQVKYQVAKDIIREVPRIAEELVIEEIERLKEKVG